MSETSQGIQPPDLLNEASSENEGHSRKFVLDASTLQYKPENFSLLVGKIYAERDIEDLAQGTINLINKCPHDHVDTIFFLEKSARPAAHLFRKTWEELLPETQRPKIRFINIGRERSIDNEYKFNQEIAKDLHERYKAGFINNNLLLDVVIPEVQDKYGDNFLQFETIERDGVAYREFKDTDENREHREQFKNEIEEKYRQYTQDAPNMHILVVDEWVDTGKTLPQAVSALQQIFPEAEQVDSMQLFENQPRWMSQLYPSDIGVIDQPRNGLPTARDYIVRPYRENRPQTREFREQLSQLAHVIAKSVNGSVLERQKEYTNQQQLIAGTSVKEEIDIPESLQYSGVLYDKLVQRLSTPEKRIKTLISEYASFDIGKDSIIIGRVVKVDGREVTIQPVQKATSQTVSDEIQRESVINEPEITRRVLFISDNYHVFPPDLNDTDTLVRVFATHGEPDQVIIPIRNSFFYPEDSQGVNFMRDDPYLGEIIKEALQIFPTIDGPSDLAKLTSWVHNRIPYVRIEKLAKEQESRFISGKDYPDYSLPIGQVVEKVGAACRTIAAIELAILETGFNIHASPTVSHPKDETSGHLYLEVPLTQKLGSNKKTITTYIADPTWDVYGIREDVIEQLKIQGYNTSFHESSESFPLVPKWNIRWN